MPQLTGCGSTKIHQAEHHGLLWMNGLDSHEFWPRKPRYICWPCGFQARKAANEDFSHEPTTWKIYENLGYQWLSAALSDLPWFISTARGVSVTPMPTFGPLGDGTDAENAGPTVADGIKPGQYTCFDSRWNPGSKLSKPCIKVGTSMPLKPLKHT